MEKTLKIEIRPTRSQKEIIHKTLGVCRYLWNEFLFRNAEHWNENKEFFDGNTFSKYVNNVLGMEKPWIKEVSSKARKDVIDRVDAALWRHFKSKGTNHEIGYPRIKRKNDPVNSYYFIKDGVRLDESDNSYLWIPILRWVKLKERDYITEDLIPYVTSGRIVREKDKYYVMLILQGDIPRKHLLPKEKSNGIGIDLGTRSLCTIYPYDKTPFIQNPIYSDNYRECERKIRRLQQVISHKEEVNMRKYGYDNKENIKKEDATNIYRTHNILKLRKRISKLKGIQTRIMHDYIKRLCSYLVRTNPEYITIEDLDIEGMLQDASHQLACHIQNSRFYYFRTFLQWKCREYGIELRIADHWYASSKTCSRCGHKRKKLRLDERTYYCKKCGLKIDRDLNAAINLYNTKDYTLAG